MPDELEFFRDERIYLVCKVDDDWYEGEVLSGERGLVPANLLRMFSALFAGSMFYAQPRVPNALLAILQTGSLVGI